MERNGSLSSLREGGCCIVTDISAAGKMRSRFIDLGVEKGARIECLHARPGGGIAAYLICGAVIALRSADAACIRGVISDPP